MVVEGESIVYQPPPVVASVVGFNLPPMVDQGHRGMERDREMDLESVLTEGTSLVHVRCPQESAMPSPPPSRGLLSYITGGFFSGPGPTDQRDPNAVPPPELIKQAAGGGPVEMPPSGGGMGFEQSVIDEDQVSVQTGRTRHTAMSSHNPGLGSMGYFDNADAYVYDATSSMYSLQASGVMIEHDAAVGASTMSYSLCHSGVMVDVDRDETVSVMIEGEESSETHTRNGDEDIMVVDGGIVEGKVNEDQGKSSTPFGMTIHSIANLTISIQFNV